ncbi:hypothetical protein [Alterisphingorhabdus coralli]|uniref:Uncharacterized protein n=1 Tax=Alterisphingorhabdus coralli TaxID=3071408 RepID=A0AA97F959_9SPHN|nr:hypothetical protein [Parasphingorhabdus sp. SCSIO 66989]WOE76258.1 hypothetical protein RB602_05970 [Parasphingorhabdus sp. SCSIO 66989]
MIVRSLSAIALCAALAVPGVAQEEKQEQKQEIALPEIPALVPTFEQNCMMQGINHEDRIEAIKGSGQWEEDDDVTISIAHLGEARSVGIAPNFREISEARQWSGQIDGRPAKLVLVTFAEEDRFNHACAIVGEYFGSALHYRDEIEDAFEKFGVDPQSVDLTHYFEFGGDIGAWKDSVAVEQRIHGELYARSQAISTEENMHVYVAY